jgi:hypothetical protein
VFDKKMGDTMNFWKNHLHNVESELWKKLREMIMLCTLWLAG